MGEGRGQKLQRGRFGSDVSKYSEQLNTGLVSLKGLLKSPSLQFSKTPLAIDS